MDLLRLINSSNRNKILITFVVLSSVSFIMKHYKNMFKFSRIIFMLKIVLCLFHDLSTCTFKDLRYKIKIIRVHLVTTR